MGLSSGHVRGLACGNCSVWNDELVRQVAKREHLDVKNRVENKDLLEEELKTGRFGQGLARASNFRGRLVTQERERVAG